MMDLPVHKLEKTERAKHGTVICDDMLTVVIEDEEAGTLTQRPFIGDNAQVGYQLTHSDGRVEYIYFNTSNGGDGTEGPGGGPGFNTFIYHGPVGDPDGDEPQHYYYLFDPEDWAKWGAA